MKAKLPGSNAYHMTPEIKERIRHLHIDQGVSVKALTIRFGISRSVMGTLVGRLREEAGLPPLNQVCRSEFGDAEIRRNPSLRMEPWNSSYCVTPSQRGSGQ